MDSFAPRNRPQLAAPIDDPFISKDATASPHHRFSTFNYELFADGPGSSPGQAKRALEAHLAETERRLDEASKLGTALVSQRKTLTEQLREVEKLQAQGELNPELRQKLAEIEKEYNDLARESARAFLPKQRVASNEINPGSPYAPEGRSSGRRSVSPSKFESQATGSPTKLSVPNRKIRNQPSNRVHDIEFAAEISTSLIAQVRNLQALLAERDEEVKDLKNDLSSIERESEGLQQRLKSLDESEHRLKEENWNLETRLQEISSLQRDAADREKKLTQALATCTTEKVTAQKELDEVRSSYSKLIEEHAASVKHHDIELGTAKRNIAMAETERSTMQRKIDDLTSQNQELAKAFSTQRGRTMERESASGQSESEFETANDNITPEHSPPPSPVKGTPRHSMLETETMKTSLHHAQRTIQSQRSQIHREKTEKLELRRIIQELRDDLEKSRKDSVDTAANRRSRKIDPKDLKKSARLLGGFRTSRQEILPSIEDPEWEDQGDISPRASSVNMSPSPIKSYEDRDGDSSAQFETAEEFDTANEASESAFETAHERATETEDFQTVNEVMSDDEDTATETETVSRGFGKMKKAPSLPAVLPRPVTRSSFDSTASTSPDEEDLPHNRTPTSTLSSQRSRLRLNRSFFGRSSRQASEEPMIRSSPMSVSSASGTATPIQQSLFAELLDFEPSDDESVQSINTPSRRSIRSITPASIRRRLSPIPPVPAMPKPLMLDAGVMTDAVIIHDNHFLAPSDHSQRPSSSCSILPLDESFLTVRGSDVEAPSRLSTYSDMGSQHDPDMETSLAQLQAPPSSSSLPPVLSVSEIQFEMIDPQEVSETPPPTLKVTPIFIQNDMEPIEAIEIPPPVLSLSTITTQESEPITEPEIPAAALSLSTISSHSLEPVEEPEIPAAALSLSTIESHSLEPVEEPEILPDLCLAEIQAQSMEPIPEPKVLQPALTLTSLSMETVEPRMESELPRPELSMTAIQTEMVEPIAEPELIVPPAPVLSLSAVMGEEVEPVPDRRNSISIKPTLVMSGLFSENIEPVVVSEPETASPVVPVVVPVVKAESPRMLPELSISAISTHHDFAPLNSSVFEAPELRLSSLSSIDLMPVPEEAKEIVLPILSYSDISTEFVEPAAEHEPLPVPLTYSGLAAQVVDPISEPENPPAQLVLSTILAEDVVPIAERPPTLVISSNIASEAIEPIAAIQMPPPSLTMSTISTECVVPIAASRALLSLSSISSHDLSPIAIRPPSLVMSSIASQHTIPVPLAELPLPNFGFSSIETVETVPEAQRDSCVASSVASWDKALPETPKRQTYTSVFELADSSPIIAEDETSESTFNSPPMIESEIRQPFTPISNNSGNLNLPKITVPTNDQGAQTSLTAETIDQLFKSTSRASHQQTSSVNSIGTPGTIGTIKVNRQDDRGGYSPTPYKRGMLDDFMLETGPSRRPGSAASNRSSIRDAPPLPANHLEIIEAARSSSANGVHGSMPPPLWPASAFKHRPQTPSQPRPASSQSVRGVNTTPRALGTYSAQSHRDSEYRTQSRLTAISRQSSVSSFGDELDSRFNMRNGGLDPTGFGSNTDPRMIQAITQTMIGEYLWKYTRKTGRGEMSEKRHRRYFWVHPYTRTLYWSDRDPSTAGRLELKAKSVSIEAVRVVTDDNPMPPGLHRKSLVIIAPGRTIKFTCTTGQRHEIWFNALSYLLLRTNTADPQTDTEEMAQSLTQDDVDEFNPDYSTRPANGNRLRAAPSMSSYHSRTTQQSPTPDMTIPTLTPKGPQKKASHGTLNRVSGYLRSGGKKMSANFSSLRGRGPNSAQSVYEAEDAHDSAEDLREMIEQQDRDADRMENVRACCDGKHDVGTLPYTFKRGRLPLTHSHPGPSTTTPMASTRSRI